MKSTAYAQAMAPDLRRSENRGPTYPKPPQHHRSHVLSAMDIGQNISDAEIEALSGAATKTECVLSKLEASGD
jgi:hypothetical protein